MQGLIQYYLLVTCGILLSNLIETKVCVLSVNGFQKTGLMPDLATFTHYKHRLQRASVLYSLKEGLFIRTRVPKSCGSFIILLMTPCI